MTSQNNSLPAPWEQQVERALAAEAALAVALEALQAADAVLREIYVRTGDLAAARAHDAVYGAIYRAGGR